MILIYDLLEKNENNDEEEKIFSAEKDLLWYMVSE